MDTERSLILLKPDAIEKKVDDKIIGRLLNEKFKIEKMEKIRLTKEKAELHYIHLKGNIAEDRFEKIINFMTGADVIAIILSGDNVIAKVREMAGPTFNAPAGTIRGDFGSESYRNLIHASDSRENAEKEIANLFYSV